MFSTILFLFLSLVQLSVQQKDPLKDFCRLHGHQTTVVDRNLYIDGGLVNWAPLSAGSLNYSSTWLKAGHLDENNEGFPQQDLLAKNETVPSVHGGILWADEANKIVYQYGGEYGNEKPDEFSLWYYDIAYNTWNVSNASTTDVNRASWGAGVTVQDKAKGYYYGGWLTNASMPGYGDRTALSNMLVYDMPKGSFRNQSGPDNTPRAEGSMVYIPAGDAGLLVYFGGVQVDNTTVKSSPMNQIYIYDVGNAKWYTETATGEVPGDRRRFCAGATWADDRSSYNIYLYGGASIDQGVGYGDVYVLSLPSFKWIKFWPRAEDNIGAVFPHHSLSCDVIGGSQMIIMGGHFTNSSDCDVASVYGQHGLNLGQAKEKWAMFDPKKTTYKVPNEIIKVVGGDGGGNAAVSAPANGFKNRDLNVQFSRAYTPAVRSATRFLPSATGATSPTTTASPPSKSNKGSIIAGTLGGIGGLCALIAGVSACMIVRRRKRNAANSTPSSGTDSRSLAQNAQPHDMSRSQSTRTMTTVFGTPNIHKGPNDMWPQYGSHAPPHPDYPPSHADYPPSHSDYPPSHPPTPHSAHTQTSFSRSLTQRSAPEFSTPPQHSPFARSLTVSQRPGNYAYHPPPPMPTSHHHLPPMPQQFQSHPNPLDQNPHFPPAVAVAYEMPAGSTVHEMPITRSPPSFSKPFHAQPEKFGGKFQAPNQPIDPYYAQNPPGGSPSQASSSLSKGTGSMKKG